MRFIGRQLVLEILAVSVLCACNTVAVRAQGQPTTVPFVGCKSDGQVGPRNAPQQTPVPLRIGANDAQELAYYRTLQGLGVLAPRDWYCFGTYGSGGERLLVSPDSIDFRAAVLFEPKRTGPAIQVSRSFGGTSGRGSVSETIARVFPAYKDFTRKVMRDLGQPLNSLSFGPYSTDRLRYLSDAVVEYQTPAHKEGLATCWALAKSGIAIEGVAMLVGEDPDLLTLAVRLPVGTARLAPGIVAQFEGEWRSLAIKKSHPRP